jgi:protein involved in polysaccharide export with SLBB domain
LKNYVIKIRISNLGECLVNTKFVVKAIVLTLFGTTLFSCASKKIDYKTYNGTYQKKEVSSAQDGLRQLKDVPRFNKERRHMAPGFLFSLHHISDDKLRGRFRANYNGLLKLPYGVRLDVKNKSFKQLRKEVLKAYERFFQKGVRNVTFSIKSRSYFVDIRGLVKKPGRYLVTQKESLDKVIDQAGGLDGNIKDELFSVSLKQKNQSYAVSLNQFYQSDVFNQVFTWTGEDTVFIKRQSESSGGQSIPVVTIMSGVKNPGKNLYQSGASLFYYLNKSGGIHEYTAYDEAYIIRKTDNGLKKIRFNLTRMETIPTVEPYDIIMLNSEKTTPVDKALSRTAQISSILSTLALLLLAL